MASALSAIVHLMIHFQKALNYVKLIVKYLKIIFRSKFIVFEVLKLTTM